MKISYAGFAILAPALVSAAAFAIPEPTLFPPAADNWSPAPTTAPQLHLNIFGREAQQATQDSTCGYVSGQSESSVTCPNSKAICATNTYFGVHGCCDPSNLSACTIATTCIPSSAMKTDCTDSACSTNDAIAKCTGATATACYQWLFVYDTTTMTQHGCTATGFTSTALRSYGATSASVVVVTSTVYTSAFPISTPTSSSPPADDNGDKKQSLAPIVGGTLGGCIILSLVALTAFLIHRRRTAASNSHAPPASHFHHNSPEFNPDGFPTAHAWSQQDIKTWQQGARAGTSPYLGVSEVHGQDRAVEVEAPEKSKFGWRGGGRDVVEVEAPVEARTPVVVEAPMGRVEKGRGGVVEAPS